MVDSLGTPGHGGPHRRSTAPSVRSLEHTEQRCRHTCAPVIDHGAISPPGCSRRGQPQLKRASTLRQASTGFPHAACLWESASRLDREGPGFLSRSPTPTPSPHWPPSALGRSCPASTPGCVTGLEPRLRRASSTGSAARPPPRSDRQRSGHRRVRGVGLRRRPSTVTLQPDIAIGQACSPRPTWPPPSTAALRPGLPGHPGAARRRRGYWDRHRIPTPLIGTTFSSLRHPPGLEQNAPAKEVCLYGADLMKGPGQRSGPHDRGRGRSPAGSTGVSESLSLGTGGDRR